MTKIAELMTTPVLSVRRDETADVAARLLAGGNIGAAPVVDEDERVVGMVTDRDLVVRCMALGRRPETVRTEEIMTSGPLVAQAEESAAEVAARMGRAQVRRVPVVRGGVLAGIVSLSDLARGDIAGAARALSAISSNVSRR